MSAQVNPPPASSNAAVAPRAKAYPRWMSRIRASLHGFLLRRRWQWRAFHRNLSDPGWAKRREWRQKLSGPDYEAVFNEAEPLVTVCIATYTRGSLLIERSLQPCLA
ncbi:MAG TPA: hypothetical protein VFS42_02170, partial [Burkholderiaceae bacterium]|nr:hypothetical protein [Burkholderiaceae bacterium]